jgi:Circularly permutated YpsA SLOG family
VILKKVISGGQNGADLGALKAAKAFGLQTGGMMPKGWRTLDGPRPNYKTYFGMTEHPSPNYPQRTIANVANSDATLRFAADWKSAGEVCTWKAINRCGMETMGVNLVCENGVLSAYDPTRYDQQRAYDPDVENVENYAGCVADWLLGLRVGVLNVAGNSEKTCPGIGKFVERFMLVVFADLTKETCLRSDEL